MNNLLSLLKSKIGSGPLKSKNTLSKEAYVEDTLATETDLENFLQLAITELNQFTGFGLTKDSGNLEEFSDIVVEGAHLHFLARQALLEKGKEWIYSDKGVVLEMSGVSSLLNDQWSALFPIHLEKLKMIQNSIASSMFDGDICMDCHCDSDPSYNADISPNYIDCADCRVGTKCHLHEDDYIPCLYCGYTNCNHVR